MEEVSKFCSNCGEKLTPNAKFCPNCGTAVPKEDPFTCSNCGEKLAPNAKFCPNCGTAVSQGTLTNPNVKPEGDAGVGRVDQPTTSGIENGHEWVDLGLSVKWATCNVGADSPEEDGDYFAWGEVRPKAGKYGTPEYTGDNYKFYKYSLFGKLTVLKYFDGIEQLALCDDAANAQWGKGWRMPTIEEFIELIENCTMEWKKVNGVKGRLFTSKVNGNSIFLPPVGMCKVEWGESVPYSESGDCGYYWSSSSDKNDITHAHLLYFGDEWVKANLAYYIDDPEEAEKFEPFAYTEERCFGLSIRPVLPVR